MLLSEIEKWRMRQNPAVSRVQVGGRPMPAWFSASLVNQSRSTVRTPDLPLPPLPTEPPPEEESEYEEIEHLPRYSNSNSNMRRSSGASKRSCDLCGNCNAVVRCEMCNNQIFCGSCNEMYHRHPKRHNHSRKILENLENRPPLPPKVIAQQESMLQQQQQQQQQMGPVAPPRRHRRFGFRSGTSSPTSLRKFPFDPVGSLKRFVGANIMGQRPLPTTPRASTADLGRPPTPTMHTGRLPPPGNMNFGNTPDRRFSVQSPPSHRGPPQRSSSITNSTMPSASGMARASIPLTVLEMSRGKQHQSTLQSMSVANLHEKHPSRDSGYRGWEEDDEIFGRSHSISATNLNSSMPQNHHPHFATLTRNPRAAAKPPLKQPPPVPPRDFSHQPQRYQSASVFELNRIGNASAFTPWPTATATSTHRHPGYTEDMDFPHQQRMDYPGTLQRQQSYGADQSNAAGFGWGPVGPFGPPMSQSEMELELLGRRGSMPRELPCYGNQGLEAQFRSIERNGSLRRKPPAPMAPIVNRQMHNMPPNPVNTRPNRNPVRNESPVQFQQNLRSPEGKYYSGEFPYPDANARNYKNEENENNDDSDTIFTENPEGPWSCEHCTFVNPKSTKICTICCKTPSKGYPLSSKPSTFKVIDTRSRPSPSPAPKIENPKQRPQPQRSLIVEDEVDDIAPVVKAKLTFSSRKTGNDQKVKHSVEQMRSTSSSKPPVSPWSRTSSFDYDNNNSESEESEEEPEIEITQRHKPSVNKNKITRGGPSTQRGETRENSEEEIPKRSMKKAASPGVRVSTGAGSSSPKYTDSGVGDSPVLEVAEEFNRVEQNVQQPGTKETILPQTPGTKKILKSSISTSTSPVPVSSSSFFGRDVTVKNSKGTSPPPQEISTQTYEELPGSKMRQMSASKASIQSDLSRDASPPAKSVEMSDKALRYARRAQQQSKLKRSLSTHLTSDHNPSDNWVDMHHHSHSEGRHLYRSSSRHSLASDTRSLPISGPPSRDTSPPRGNFRDIRDDLHRFPPPSWDRFPSPADYFASVEDLVGRKRRESIRSQEFELSRLLKEAEEFNYTPEDLQVALRMCGDRNPIKWLQENWSSMIETVQTLATKYGREKGMELNEVGTISPSEAKDALRLHRGNVWAAVTECVEQRRKKFLELQSRGTFIREDVLTALTANHGNLDAAYVELSKAQLKPFLMRIWGPPNGLNNEAYPPRSPSIISLDAGCSSVSVGKVAVGPSSNESVPSASKMTEPREEIFETTPLVLSPITLTQGAVPTAVSEVKAVDVEEERFDDAKSDNSDESGEKEQERLAQGIREAKIVAKNQVDSTPGQNSEPEDGEEDFEENISHFIQNYEISEPKAIPNLDQEKTLELVEPGNEVSQPKLELDLLGTTSAAATSSAEIASLTMAVNAISLQLQTLIKQQETPSTSNDTNPPTPVPSNQSFGGDVAVDGIRPSPTPPPADPKILKDIYKDDLRRLKEIVLQPKKHEQDPSNYSPRGFLPESDNFQVYESVDHKQPAVAAAVEVKSRPYKLYEAIGNFAGTFLKAAMKKEPGKIYEAIQSPADQGFLPRGHQESEFTKERSIDLKGGGDGGQEDKNSSSVVALTENPAPAVRDEPSITPNEDFIPSSGILLQENHHFDPDELADEDNLSSTPSSPSPPSGDADDLEIPESTATTATGKTLKEFLIRGEANSSPDPNERDNEIESGEEFGDEDEEGESIDDDDEDVGSGSPGESSGQNSLSDRVFENEMEGDSQDEEQLYEEIEPGFASGPGQNKINTTATGPATDATTTVEEVRGKDDFSKRGMGSSSSSAQTQSKIKRLMSSGLAKSYEKAEIAVKLMDMHFDEEDSLYAAKECSSLYSAISFLQQECHLCGGKVSAKQMVSMLRCTHWCCRTCAAGYFMVQLRDHTILEAVCPFCKEPSTLSDDPEVATDYFSHLDILLKELMDERHHEMFQRKLRDWTLAKTPNFKWCSKCSSGFITDPAHPQALLVCPDCSAVTCAICLEPWDKENHSHKDGRERHNSIQSVNSSSDPTDQSIIDYLNQNCIECPRCHLKFTLARGGCMHLTCSQCCFEFCSGCLAPFRVGSKCPRNSPFCVKLGLHAHHPRNCLFYLRDKEPEPLTQLLEENEIAYFKETTTGETALKIIKKCQVPIQKESDEGLQDDYCGQEVLKGYSTVCQTHYVEYLGLLIWQNRLDPISILSNDDLETIIRRDDKKLPGKAYGTKDADYRPLLLKVIENEIPMNM